MKYYRLKDDIEYPNRWYLGDILDVDGWELLSSVPKIDNKLDVELYQDGDEMDFTLSEVYGIPIVSEKVKQALEFLSEIRFIPLTVTRRRDSCNSQYFAMVILLDVDCVDEGMSEFQKFEINDPVRPDKAREYRSFTTLRLNPENILGIDIFRLKKFETAIIVSEQVKTILEAIGATGLNFSSVTLDSDFQNKY